MPLYVFCWLVNFSQAGVVSIQVETESLTITVQKSKTPKEQKELMRSESQVNELIQRIPTILHLCWIHTVVLTQCQGFILSYRIDHKYQYTATPPHLLHLYFSCFCYLSYPHWHNWPNTNQRLTRLLVLTHSSGTFYHVCLYVDLGILHSC